MSAIVLAVIPAYNASATIEQAIQSVLAQKHRAIRLHVVDDCSTDNTYQLAKAFERDSRVKVFRNLENRGAYYSRNAGLYYGRAHQWQYFTTHDADDVSYPTRFSTMVKALERPTRMGVQDTFLRVSWPDMTPLGESLTMAHAMFKRQVFKNLGYFHEVRFGADWEYWHRLNALNRINGHTSYAINTTLGTSYIHGNNLTVQVPLGSVQRRSYVRRIRDEVRVLARRGQLYRDVDGSTIERLTRR